jgi:hypothetical protein
MDNLVSQAGEPVAKPPVLQLAGGAKLRPTEVGFGATSYESIIPFPISIVINY